MNGGNGVEERCMRAGKLQARLENDRRRVFRRMETRDMDMILEDGPEWWLMAMRWTGLSEASEADVRIGGNIDKELLGGKPVMVSHHGRSTPGGKPL